MSRVITVKQLQNKIKFTDEQLDLICSDKHLQVLADHIEEYQQYAHVLKLKGWQLTEINQGSAQSYSMKTLAVLKRWKENDYLHATYRNLLESTIALREGSVAITLCQLCKERNPSGESAEVSSSDSRAETSSKLKEKHHDYLAELQTALRVSDSQLRLPITEEHYRKIAEQIEDYEPFANALGLKGYQITEVRTSAELGYLMKTQAVLKCWKDINPFEATYLNFVLVALELRQGSVATSVIRLCKGNWPDPDDDSERFYRDALKEGYITVKSRNVLLFGMAGTGKTSTKHVILGLPPPEKRNSTEVADAGRVYIRDVGGIRIEIGKRWRKFSLKDLKESLANPKFRKSSCKYEVSEVSEEKSKQGSHVLEIRTNENDDQPAEQTPTQEEYIPSRFMEDLKHLEPGEILSLDWIYLIDSGGQPHFHNLLPLFIQEMHAALYVIRLFDRLEQDYPQVKWYKDGKPVGNGFKSCFTAADNFKYLVRSIQSRNGYCKLICIGTFPEFQPNPEPSSEKSNKLLQLLPDSVKQVCHNYKDSKREIIISVNTQLPSMVFVEGSELGEEIQEAVAEEQQRIRKEKAEEIQEAIEGSLYEVTQIPIRWFGLEIMIESKLEGKKVISLHDCKTIAKDLQFSNNRALIEALKFFHKHHIFHYYHDVEGLQEVVFCDVQVLVDKFTELIEHAVFLRDDDKKTAPAGHNNDFKSGIVTLDLLKSKKFNNHFEPNLFEPNELVLVFEHLLIAVEETEKHYYMPSLLPILSAGQINMCRKKLLEKSTPLVIKFKNGLPRCGFFCCLQVYLIKECGWERVTDVEMAQNMVTFLPKDFPLSVTLVDCFSHFEVYVEVPSPGLSTFSPPVNPSYSTICNQIILGVKVALSKLKYSNVDDLQYAFLCPEYSPKGDVNMPFFPAKDSMLDINTLKASIIQDKLSLLLNCPVEGHNDCHQLHVGHLQWLGALDSVPGLNQAFFAYRYWKLNELNEDRKAKSENGDTMPLNGEGVWVAVIDSGVTINHKAFTTDLEGHRPVKYSRNFVKDSDFDKDCKDVSEKSHGTAVAGVLAGSHRLGRSSMKDSYSLYDGCTSLKLGVAPKVSIVSCGVFEGEECSPKDVVKALKWIYEHNCVVMGVAEEGSGHLDKCKLCEEESHSNGCNKICIVNMSIRLPNPKQEEKEHYDDMKKLIDKLTEQNVICVAGAGNDGRNEDPGYPAKYDNVLSVGSCNQWGIMSDFSSRHEQTVNVLALGQDVLAPVNKKDYHDKEINSHTKKSTAKNPLTPGIHEPVSQNDLPEAAKPNSVPGPVSQNDVPPPPSVPPLIHIPAVEAGPNFVERVNGTSFATPAVSGLIAILIQCARGLDKKNPGRNFEKVITDVVKLKEFIRRYLTSSDTQMTELEKCIDKLKSTSDRIKDKQISDQVINLKMFCETISTQKKGLKGQIDKLKRMSDRIKDKTFCDQVTDLERFCQSNRMLCEWTIPWLLRPENVHNCLETMCDGDPSFIESMETLGQCHENEILSPGCELWKTELIHTLHSVHKNWYLLGIQLEIDHPTLEEIRTNFKDDAKDCFRELISRFLDSKHPQPKATVMEALRSPSIAAQDDLVKKVEQLTFFYKDKTTVKDCESLPYRLKKVLNIVWDMRDNWESVAGKLSFAHDDCEAIKKNHGERADNCFATILYEHLKESGDRGLTMLVEALRASASGGEENELAIKQLEEAW